MQAMLSTSLKTAWEENAALAIRLNSRFRSTALTSELRGLLLKFPERAISEPDALPILLGDSLPDDLSSQLKVMPDGVVKQAELMLSVSSLLGTGQPNYCRQLFSSVVPQSSVDSSIRYARP